MAVDKSKKPKIEFDCTCPNCHSVLKVLCWKQAIGEPPEPREYDIETEVSVKVQGDLFRAKPAKKKGVSLKVVNG